MSRGYEYGTRKRINRPSTEEEREKSAGNDIKLLLRIRKKNQRARSHSKSRRQINDGSENMKTLKAVKVKATEGK